MSAKFVEGGILIFFLRLGGAIGASTWGLWSDDEAPIVVCFVLDAFVLAMTSGSCSGMHAFSFLYSVCAVPADNVIVLGNWEYLFELGVDEESKEFEDRAVTDAAFPRQCSGKGPEK